MAKGSGERTFLRVSSVVRDEPQFLQTSYSKRTNGLYLAFPLLSVCGWYLDCSVDLPSEAKTGAGHTEMEVESCSGMLCLRLLFLCQIQLFSLAWSRLLEQLVISALMGSNLFHFFVKTTGVGSQLLLQLYPSTQLKLLQFLVKCRKILRIRWWKDLKFHLRGNCMLHVLDFHGVPGRIVLSSLCHKSPKQPL